MEKTKKIKKIIEITPALLQRIIEASEREERSVKNYIENLIKQKFENEQSENLPK